MLFIKGKRCSWSEKTPTNMVISFPVQSLKSGRSDEDIILRIRLSRGECSLLPRGGIWEMVPRSVETEDMLDEPPSEGSQIPPDTIGLQVASVCRNWW